LDNNLNGYLSVKSISIDIEKENNKSFIRGSLIEGNFNPLCSGKDTKA
jgi:hypothetical protein